MSSLKNDEQDKFLSCVHKRKELTLLVCSRNGTSMSQHKTHQDQSNTISLAQCHQQGSKHKISASNSYKSKKYGKRKVLTCSMGIKPDCKLKSFWDANPAITQMQFHLGLNFWLEIHLCFDLTRTHSQDLCSSGIWKKVNALNQISMSQQVKKKKVQSLPFVVEWRAKSKNETLPRFSLWIRSPCKMERSRCHLWFRSQIGFCFLWSYLES